jgi:hypothetical protein
VRIGFIDDVEADRSLAIDDLLDALPQISVRLS